MLVDLEQHQPVDMLPDRTAATLAAWLNAHPGVEVIARDRSTEYARGARDGAPSAQQVADRWHLLQNIREALERVLTQLRPHLLRLEPANGPDGQPRRKRLKLVSPSELERQRQRREERLARYQQVKQLAAAGLSQREIAQQVGVCRGTVIQYVRAEAFLELPPQRVRPSRLDRYRPFLERRCVTSGPITFLCMGAPRHHHRQLASLGATPASPGTQILLAQVSRSTPVGVPAGLGCVCVVTVPPQFS